MYDNHLYFSQVAPPKYGIKPQDEFDQTLQPRVTLGNFFVHCENKGLPQREFYHIIFLHVTFDPHLARHSLNNCNDVWWNYPQQLTPKGKRVEKALAEFRREVDPPHFTTGYVDGCCPSLKLTVSEPEAEITLQYPYASVEELYPIAEQSQVGTAKKTLHRLDARKSKEFSSIEVLNESWKEKIATVCGQIGQVLAPGAKKVNAELYKLLIYREEDFFCCHQDAQHSARMFATLLFFMPVKYTGGEFNIYQPGTWKEKFIVEDRKKSDGCSWVAFYTDVRHEVSKVEGGFRVVLNYHLSFDGAMSPSIFLPTGSVCCSENY